MDVFEVAFVVLIFLIAVGVQFFAWSMKKNLLRRASFIQNYTFPVGLAQKLQSHYPHLTTEDYNLVSKGLRQFFLAHLKSGRQFVAMPSQVVDELWHEFILYTKDYEAFCQEAFGRCIHHTPVAVLGQREFRSNQGLRRCWAHACREENIDPLKPVKLPLLFALDTQLAIPNGIRYLPCCDESRNQAIEQDTVGGTIYYSSDFSSTSFDGSISGLEGNGDSGGSSGDGDSGGGGGDGGGS